MKGHPGSDNDHVQVAALNAILDRAYGKPKQPVEEEMLTGISAELQRFMDDNSGKPTNFVGFSLEDDDGSDSVH